jgi:hypothetical protein
MRDITKFVANSKLLRSAVEKWRAELPPANDPSIKALNEIRRDTADKLDQIAEMWRSENKLIHEGAARRLAAELRKKI